VQLKTGFKMNVSYMYSRGCFFDFGALASPALCAYLRLAVRCRTATRAIACIFDDTLNDVLWMLPIGTKRDCLIAICGGCGREFDFDLSC